jgi:hypothetical protein
MFAGNPFPKYIRPTPSGPHCPAPERVDHKQPEEIRWNGWVRSVLAPQTIDQRQDRTIAIVQAAAAVALEIVVVGPADIGVRVHGRNVGPHVVGISRQIRWKQWRAAEGDIHRAVEIATHVIRGEQWRPQAIVSDEAGGLTSHR